MTSGNTHQSSIWLVLSRKQTTWCTDIDLHMQFNKWNNDLTSRLAPLIRIPPSCDSCRKSQKRRKAEKRSWRRNVALSQTMEEEQEERNQEAAVDSMHLVNASQLMFLSDLHWKECRAALRHPRGGGIRSRLTFCHRPITEGHGITITSRPLSLCRRRKESPCHQSLGAQTGIPPSTSSFPEGFNNIPSFPQLHE